MAAFSIGKLPSEVLARLLADIAPGDSRVLVGPGVGVDCAVIDLENGNCLVAKSDPITFASDAIGWYAVHVNANDIVTMGAAPRWFLATLLLPEGKSDAALVESIFTQVREACREIGVAPIGGHTEITYGIDRPIVVGAMLGEVAREQLITPAGARVGDALLLTKRLAVEATSILAREKAPDLVGKFDLAYLHHARRFLYDPGISVVRDAQVAIQAGRVHAMHDPTEGGLATGLHELAIAAHVGLEIDAQAAPIYPETQALCAAFGIDVWGVIASGSLLMAVAAEDAEQIIAALRGVGIEASIIGRVVAREQGVVVREATGVRPLPIFARDEITKAFL
ncbi:MAG TPA: AIR synthase family protein [Anaerolineae bacterium]|nr:AIR synthase family protein [Anaerolineae bacterium]